MHILQLAEIFFTKKETFFFFLSEVLQINYKSNTKNDMLVGNQYLINKVKFSFTSTTILIKKISWLTNLGPSVFMVMSTTTFHRATHPPRSQKTCSLWEWKQTLRVEQRIKWFLPYFCYLSVQVPWLYGKGHQLGQHIQLLHGLLPLEHQGTIFQYHSLIFQAHPKMEKKIKFKFVSFENTT